MDITKNSHPIRKNKIEVNTSNLYNIDSLIKTDTRIDWIDTILILLFFIIIFFILIPTILYKNKYYTFLEAYLPNIDLIANLLTFHGGPFRGSWLLKNMFANLYQITPISTRAFFSQSVIMVFKKITLLVFLITMFLISKSSNPLEIFKDPISMFIEIAFALGGMSELLKISFLDNN